MNVVLGVSEVRPPTMFNLTRQERQVILFLIITTLAGIGINFLNKRYSQVRIIAYLSQDINKISLNKADRQMLTDISGIGDKLAQRIIEYRNNCGNFKGIEELKNIKGISQSKYEAIKDYFYLE